MDRSGLVRKVEEATHLVDRAYGEWTRSAGEARAAAYMAIREAERERDEALRALIRVERGIEARSRLGR